MPGETATRKAKTIQVQFSPIDGSLLALMDDGTIWVGRSTLTTPLTWTQIEAPGCGR